MTDRRMDAMNYWGQTDHSKFCQAMSVQCLPFVCLYVRRSVCLSSVGLPQDLSYRIDAVFRVEILHLCAELTNRVIHNSTNPEHTPCIFTDHSEDKKANIQPMPQHRIKMPDFSSCAFSSRSLKTCRSTLNFLIRRSSDHWVLWEEQKMVYKTEKAKV